MAFGVSYSDVHGSACFMEHCVRDVIHKMQIGYTWIILIQGVQGEVF